MARLALSLTLIAAALGTSCHRSSAAAADPPPAVHTVTIEAMRFEPETLTVNAGDTVVWINKDLFPHTATATAGFDSGGIDASKSWQFVTKTRGDIAYVCTFHPTMRGTLRVK